MKDQGKQYKRKRLKIGLVMMCVLLFAGIAILAAFFLIGQNSEEKKQYEVQIKQEAQEFTEGLVQEIEQIDISDTAVLATEASTEVSTEAPTAIITEAEKKVVAEELAKLEDERKQQILKTLSVTYSKVLNEQKVEALRMIDSLIAEGKTDWAELVKKGEATAANKAMLASEYMAKVNVMEAQMDTNYAVLMETMEAQMQAEGIDPAAIIEEYQSQYNIIKEDNRNALMDKLMEKIKN